MFVHRELEDGDVYFVDNRQDRAENVDATFRVDGKAPELWDPATGETQPASYRIADGRTTVPLHLDPYGTAFVVFRAPAAAASRQIAELRETEVAEPNDELNRNWYLSFEPGRGAPDDGGVRSAYLLERECRYGNQVFLGNRRPTRRGFRFRTVRSRRERIIWLDLGDVRDVAEVAVNGKYLGILWKTPFKIDLTGVLTPGNNQLVIEVTNLWVNRMIGDQQPWALKKYTFADFTPYKADSPLLPSGLLGPVRLISVAETQDAK